MLLCGGREGGRETSGDLGDSGEREIIPHFPNVEMRVSAVTAAAAITVDKGAVEMRTIILARSAV